MLEDRRWYSSYPLLVRWVGRFQKPFVLDALSPNHKPDAVLAAVQDENAQMRILDAVLRCDSTMR